MRTAPGSAQRRAARLAVVAAACLVVILTTQAAGAASPDPADGQVAAADFEFTPATVTILAGASVTWSARRDPEQHTVTPVVAGSFEGSGPLFAGDDFTVRFNEPGTFAYACSFHPFMTGTVVVEAAAATPTKSPAASTVAVPGDSALASALAPAPVSAEPVPASPAPASPEPAEDDASIASILAVIVLIVAATVGILGLIVRRRNAA
jgi:plastocyanin